MPKVLPLKKRPFSGPSSSDDNLDQMISHVDGNAVAVETDSPSSVSAVSVAAHCISCSACEKRFSCRSNLNRHVKNAHPSLHELTPGKSFAFECDECDRRFNDRRNLMFHKRKDHESAMAAAAQAETLFGCLNCGKKFVNKSNLNRHKKTVLQCKEVPEEQQEGTSEKLLKCPVCEQSFPRSDIFCHFEDHDIQLSSQTLEFDSFDGFLSWKDSIEKETKSKFSKQKTQLCGDVKHHYYVCHRSGNFKAKGQGIRHLKTQGSQKIGAFCPASITVHQLPDGICQVKFKETHIGHTGDLGHMTLTLSERKSLAAKIASKVPFDSILDEVRDSISDSGLERLHLLTKKDLYNIESCFNLQSSAIRHKDDGISVESWVCEMKRENSCVLFYKPQGVVIEEHPTLNSQDFMLVIMNEAQTEMLKKYGADCTCIDGTHGVNGYGFELITLLVLDDMRQGFPCAFFVTSRSDQAALNIFFSCIKEKVDTIKPKVFMSDMAETFHNAWNEVMGAPGSRLYCTWHVDRAWRQNLRKITGKEKQTEVYKMLRVLLEELDPAAFSVMMEQVMKILKHDPDTIDFAKYFENQYLANTSAWAYCYRLHSGLNTNMHIERMHRTIKYIYLKGKNVKRLDKAVHGIMRFVRDKLIDRLIVLNKGKITKKLQDLRNRHKSSVCLEVNVLENEDGWIVSSTTGPNYYIFTETIKECDCQLVCVECKACIHRYMCSCPDSAVKWNMCKHIHLVCRTRNQKEVTSPCSDDNFHEHGVLKISVDSDDESEFIVAQLKKNAPSTSESALKEKQNLIAEFTTLVNAASSAEELKVLRKTITSLGPILNAVKDSSSSSAFTQQASQINIPANKNIEPQRRLLSVKKMRKAKKNICKPSSAEILKEATSLVIASNHTDQFLQTSS